MTWPSVDAPATAPSDHGEVRTQAYYAGGGDYFRSGYYSHGLFQVANMTTQALTAGVMRCRPLLVPVRRTFDRIGINVTTAATAASGGLLRMGIYGSSNGVPGALVLDAGTISSETTGAKEITISQSLDPGFYWLAVACQVSGCTVTAYASNTVMPWTAETNPTTAAGVSFMAGASRGSVTGALPNPAAVTGTGAAVAAMLRAA